MTDWRLVIEETWQPPLAVELESGRIVRYCQVRTTTADGTWVCSREIAEPDATVCPRHAAEGLGE